MKFVYSSIRENIVATCNIVTRAKEEIEMCWRNFNTKFHVYTREFLHCPFMHVKQLAERPRKNVAEILSAETEILPGYGCNVGCNKHICNYNETSVELSTKRHGKWHLPLRLYKSRIYSKMNTKYIRRKSNTTITQLLAAKSLINFDLFGNIFLIIFFAQFF